MNQTIITCEEFDKISFVPTVIIGFYRSSRKEEFLVHYRELKRRFPDVEVIGCSSESNIYDTMPHLDTTGEHLCVYLCLEMDENAFTLKISQTTRTLVLSEEGNWGVMMLCSRYSPHVEEMIDQLPERLGTTQIFGAIAGVDEQTESSADIFYNGTYYDDHVLLWLIDQNRYMLDGIGVHYFRPVGFELEVTKAEDSTLYMLNNRPALDVLEEMVGELLDDTIDAFNHPFFIEKEVQKEGGELGNPLCSIRHINRESGSIELYRHLSPKDKLKVGIVLSRDEQDKLLEVFDTFSARNCVALLFNCIGIKKNLGMMEYLYLIDLKKRLNIPMMGFHSFGEIGFPMGGDHAMLHNQTITIAVIYERDGVCS